MRHSFAVRGVLGVAVVAVAAVFWVVLRGRFDPLAIEAAVQGLGASGPLMFMGAFAAATVFFLPGSLFGLAGGALFGPVWEPLGTSSVRRLVRASRSCSRASSAAIGVEPGCWCRYCRAAIGVGAQRHVEFNRHAVRHGPRQTTNKAV